jgi:hypothetical protein
VPSYRYGVRNRWLWGDFDSLLLRLFSGRGLPSPDRLSAIREFLRFWGRDLHYENPKWNDLRPWWYETRQWIRQAAAGLAPRRQGSR